VWEDAAGDSGGSGPTLLGRDWLSSIRLNWREIHHVHPAPLQSVLAQYPSVFQEGLGTLKGFKAKIYVGPRLSTQDLCGPRLSTQDLCGPRLSIQDLCGPRLSTQDLCGPRLSTQDLCGTSLLVAIILLMYLWWTHLILYRSMRSRRSL
jgi:hypothetical protein